MNKYLDKITKTASWSKAWKDWHTQETAEDAIDELSELYVLNSPSKTPSLKQHEATLKKLEKHPYYPALKEQFSRAVRKHLNGKTDVHDLILQGNLEFD